MRILFSLLIITLAACSRNTGPDKWIPNESLTVLSERTGNTILTHTDIPKAIVMTDYAGQHRTIYVQLIPNAFDRYASLPENEPLAIRIGSDTLSRFSKLTEIGSHPPEFSLPDVILADGKWLSEKLFTRHRNIQ